MILEDFVSDAVELLHKEVLQINCTLQNYHKVDDTLTRDLFKCRLFYYTRVDLEFTQVLFSFFGKY